MTVCPILDRIRRYARLVPAIWLIASELPWSAVSFSDELDVLLNPSYFRTSSIGTALAPARLAARVHVRSLSALVTCIPVGLAAAPGPPGGLCDLWHAATRR